MEISSTIDEKASPLAFLTENAIAATIRETYDSFSDRRKALGLPNPGPLEGLSREVQRDVLCTNHMFSGLRADSNKLFSLSPVLRLQHGLALGSQNLPPYQLMAVYGTDNIYLQSALQNDGSLSTWTNWRWTPKLKSSVQTSIRPGDSDWMVQLENDYIGDDFCASLKAMNPSTLQGSLTGTVIGTWFQALSPSLSLGLEGVWMREASNTKPQTMVRYAGRYRGDGWIASGEYAPGQGAVGASYWRRLTEKVEAGVDLQLQFAPGMGGPGGMMGGVRREGVTTVGAKYDFTASTFRAQLDSTGKVAAFLDKRVTPVVGVTFAGEIDQVKQQSKIGLAVSVESAPEEFMSGIDVKSCSPPM